MNTTTLDRARQFSLASLLTSYPEAELLHTIAELPLGDHPGAARIWGFLSQEGTIDDLRSAYVDLFERGGERASLYETEYGRMRGMSKGNDLADIAGFYRAFGLDLDPDHARETGDHIAIELEFYSMLLTKQAYLDEHGDGEGSSIVLDARKKFLADHLGRFASAIALHAAVKDSDVYGPVFEWVSRIVTDERIALGVESPPLDYFADPDAKEEMKCGSVHLPIVS